MLVEREVVTQIAPRPVAVAECVLVDEEFLVEPAMGVLQARFELALAPKRPRIVGLRRELTSETVVAGNFSLEWRSSARAVLVLRLAPEGRIVLVTRSSVPEFGAEHVCARRGRQLQC